MTNLALGAEMSQEQVKVSMHTDRYQMKDCEPHRGDGGDAAPSSQGVRL